MSKAVLVDTTFCLACKACSVECKFENQPPQGQFYTRIDQIEIGEYPAVKAEYIKRQCMHCEHPACVSVCPVHALHKLPDGPVVYEADRCIGCRYCMIACPFNIPKINFNATFPVITKCTFCTDRETPVCVRTCPFGALEVGKRDELIAKAQARIAQSPDRYINHIYGQEEAGGTSWLYLSSVPFTELGLPKLGSEPVAELSEKVAVYGTPAALGTVGAALAGVYWVTKRRMEMSDPVTQDQKESE